MAANETADSVIGSQDGAVQGLCFQISFKSALLTSETLTKLFSVSQVELSVVWVAERSLRGQSACSER
jgi:hypothetical protein